MYPIDIARILSRLFMESDPQKGLSYASEAAKLGDCEAQDLQNELLGCSVSGAAEKIRIACISSLIAYLDPVFAFNVKINKAVRNTGFISYLTGTSTYLYTI